MPQDLIYITKFSSLTHSPLIYFIISHNTSSVADLFGGSAGSLRFGQYYGYSWSNTAETYSSELQTTAFRLGFTITEIAPMLDAFDRVYAFPKSAIGCYARITIAMDAQYTYRPSSWRRISATDEVKRGG